MSTPIQYRIMLSLFALAVLFSGTVNVHAQNESTSFTDESEFSTTVTVAPTTDPKPITDEPSVVPITGDTSLARMSTVELIKSSGYTVEEHEVTTKDGYILTVQRIPGKNGGKPVFLMPGLACMASSFVDRGKESLAFMLVDAGYDVWLGNQRGTPNSMKHQDFDKDDIRYWDFSMDQIAEHDVPAMWDAVLKGSKASKLQHIGFATGSTSGLKALAMYPEYNQKVERFLGLSPMSSSGYSPLPVQLPAHLGSMIKNVATPFLSYGIDFYDNSEVQNFVQSDCPPLTCAVFFGAFSGFNIKNNNKTSFLNQALHCPASSSLPYFIQFMQQIDSKRLQKYDHGMFGNLFNYGSISPPGYDFSKVSTPVALFLASNDPMANPLDVTYWQEVLPNIFKILYVSDPLFTHSDFLWGKNAPSIVYPEVLKSLQS